METRARLLAVRGRLAYLLSLGRPLALTPAEPLQALGVPHRVKSPSSDKVPTGLGYLSALATRRRNSTGFELAP